MRLTLPVQKRSRVVAILVVLGVIGVAVWMAVGRDEEPSAIATAPAVLGDIESTVLASGTLDASRMVSVGAQVSGQIKSLKVQLGQRVKAGDFIAEIDPTTQQNELRDAEAALTSVKAQRSEQEAALRRGELAYERQKTMLEGEATSQADYEEADATLRSTKARMVSLDAQIEQGAAKIDTARAKLGYTKIVAPIAGTVVAVVAKEGQTVNAIQTAPTIVKLANLDTMTVGAQISEADVIRVKAGQTVYFMILGDPHKRYYGKLRSIEPAPASVQAESGTGAASGGGSGNTSTAVYYNGQFEVPNPKGELRIAMTAQVSIVLGEAKGVLTIPSAALGQRDVDGNYLVQVVGKDGKPTPRRVTIGLNNNASAQVLSGLAVGEKVVVGEVSAEMAKMRRGGGMMMF